jgi:hypothetical protein
MNIEWRVGAVGLLALLVAACGSGAGAAGEVRVRTTDELRQAVAGAKPGTRIVLAPGEYAGDLYLQNVHGSAQAPIVIAGADPMNPPRIRGKTECIHLSEVSHLELRDLVLEGAAGNGLNIDDGGTFDTPAHHVVLRGLKVRDIGPEGNRDGIKLSGLDDFQITRCLIERWGAGGSGIDMVGCHKGVIEASTFRNGRGEAIQGKGGTSEITIRHNRFIDVGGRGVNIGGSTGLDFFRPRVQGYEAKAIRVEQNLFVGGEAPVAFVGVDGATVRQNTIYHPAKWALRILQETTAPGFVPSRNGVFSDNIVVFRSEQWTEGGVNVGPNTAPETFRFARNVWYCEDRPDRSAPRLPTPESDSLVGKDPQFVNPEAGDFRLRPGSPAAGRGWEAALGSTP